MPRWLYAIWCATTRHPRIHHCPRVSNQVLAGPAIASPYTCGLPQRWCKCGTGRRWNSCPAGGADCEISVGCLCDGRAWSSLSQRASSTSALACTGYDLWSLSAAWSWLATCLVREMFLFSKPWPNSGIRAYVVRSWLRSVHMWYAQGERLDLLPVLVVDSSVELVLWLIDWINLCSRLVDDLGFLIKGVWLGI